MRSIGTLAAVTGMLVLASACSSGAGTPPPDNTAPVANFAVPPCTINVDCGFVSTSTDDAQVTEWSWDFDGDGHEDRNTANTSFTYATAGTFNISLTVHDAQGLTDTKTSPITIAPVPPVNTPPTASFTFTCTAADCTFTSTSTDVAPGTIATYGWDFGDGATSDVSNPAHSYTVTAPTDFTVTLTVTDDEGATNVATQTVSVVPANTPPVAAFTPWCYGEGCIFTSTSTDAAPGTIVSYAWTFGDGATAEWNNWTFPQHTEEHVYTVSARTKFTVTLTVTDNEGATAVATQTFSVSPLPPAVQGCTTSGRIVECVLDMTARSTLKLKLLTVHCDIGHYNLSKISTPPPVGDQVFLSVCQLPVGKELGVFGGPLDILWVYQAGTQARIWFSQGVPRAGEPPRGPPAGQLTGTFPDWTLSFDDGDNAPPDFTDLVVGVHATVR
jgi:PKD repeat protein